LAPFSPKARPAGGSCLNCADKRRLAVRPRNGGDVFRYGLHSPDGDDLGEATYAQMIKPGEEIIAGNNQRFRVLAVVPFEEEDESPFVGLLQVDAA
jgi:hypothetical protein